MQRPSISTHDLIFVIEPQVRKFCGPLFFTTSLHTPSGNIPNTASFGLVDTGKMKLMVTCQHVWEDFKRLRSEVPNLMFGVCFNIQKPITFDLDPLLVDEEKRCDLVTFNVESLLPAIADSKLDFYNLHVNRPPKIQVGAVLYLIGFPGKGRVDGDDSVGFPMQPIGVQATEVGDFRFYADAKNLNKQPGDFGGISGSPCFLIGDGKPMRLVGFTTGYAPNDISRLSFSYASCIQSDGSIRYMI